MSESQYPRISVVTPSFNQGRFLEKTIQSVLGQGYPNLEYVVVDGGSSDGSVQIIKHYATRLSGWVSEPDGGQFDAVNKGFSRCTGEIMTWINSDDVYLPWAFQVAAQIFSRFPAVEWISSLFPLCVDADGLPSACQEIDGFSRKAFFRGAYLPGGDWPAQDYIQQEGTFWRKSLWQRAGASVDRSLKYAGDFELWARFYQHADLFGVRLPLGAFRRHEDQKTARKLEDYFAEAKAALLRHGGRPPDKWEAFAVRKLLKLRRFVDKRYLNKLARGEQMRYIAKAGRTGDWELKP